MDNIEIEDKKIIIPHNLAKKLNFNKNSRVLVEDSKKGIILTLENYTKEECENFMKQLNEIEAEMDTGNCFTGSIEELDEHIKGLIKQDK